MSRQGGRLLGSLRQPPTAAEAAIVLVAAAASAHSARPTAARREGLGIGLGEPGEIGVAAPGQTVVK